MNSLRDGGDVVELPGSRPCRRPDDGFDWRP